MIFTETRLKGAYIIDLEPIEDGRGFFARSFCTHELEKIGLVGTFVQCNISYNRRRGTLRGMHYQEKPHEEVKIVSCTRGRLHDVVVDLRADSETFRDWLAVELSQKNRRALYIPKGFAHGFQTLEDNTDVLYFMSEFYCPASARGLRWNDPALAIRWPLQNPILSEKDGSYSVLERL